MKRNRATLIITLILAFVAAILIITNKYTTLRKDDSAFAIEDTASVTKIFLADKNNREVTLERTEDGKWTVNGKHPAQQAKINSFLKTLMDLEVRAPVPLVARDNVIKRMSVLAKKAEIYQIAPSINLFNIIRLFPAEKLVKTYYVGDVTQDNQGTFMLMEGSEEPFVVFIPGFRGFVSSRYTTEAADWRDYTVFNTSLDKILSVTMEFPMNPQQSYRIDIGSNQDIVLTGLYSNQPVHSFDTVRVMNFLLSFKDIRFESLLEHLIDKEFIDSVSASVPKTIITLTDRDEKVNRVKMFRKMGFSPLYSEEGMILEPYDLDRAFALVNDEEDFVLVQYFVFDAVTRTLDYLTGKER